MSIPSDEVVRAINAGVTRVTRRAEIFESDGVTLWGSESPGMIDGSISIDYSRDERRVLELTLSNTSGWLRPDPADGFWYDKIIKVWRGVTYFRDTSPPTMVIIESESTQRAYDFQAILNQLGYTKTSVLLTASTYADISDYDFVISDMGKGKPGKHLLLKEAFSYGKKIITTGSQSTGSEIPMIAISSSYISNYKINKGLFPNRTTSPDYNWSSSVVTGSSDTVGIGVDTLNSYSEAVSFQDVSGSNRPSSFIGWNNEGGRWFHYQPSVFSEQSKILLNAAVEWVWNFVPVGVWETQLGEFYIDRISDSIFPKTVRVTGRDGTKKMINSKISQSLTFSTGTLVIDIISALANNSGIFKHRIFPGKEVLTSTFSVERNSSRWQVAKDLANSFNYELYFDSNGYLVMEKFKDPTLGAIDATFETGPKSNLSKFERSTNDSNLFNKVVVIGERNNGQMPFYGEAVNTALGSPTSVSRIGERLRDPIVLGTFSSNQQCKDFAKSILKVSSLETYEANAEAICYPWMEVGTVVEILDPARLPSDPTRYLNVSVTIPLSLGVMSFSCKRITIVGG